MLEDVSTIGASHPIIWLGICLCLTQSAILSGLNIAVFSVSRLRLEVEATGGNNPGADVVLGLRRNSNHVLTTILWGNVGINVLLALLSDSIMSGVAAFLFSTVLITIVGEIVPQAYFSRNALRMAASFAPLLRVYMLVLYPLAKPTALLLDRWLGREGPHLYRERDLREVIRKHIDDDDAEIDRLEGIGALNFLAIDDLAVAQAGSVLDAKSLISLPFDGEHPIFPHFQSTPNDAFLRRLHASGRHWVVITDLQGAPRLILDADGFLRAALFEKAPVQPLSWLYRPTIIRDPHSLLGAAISRLAARPLTGDGSGPAADVVLIWDDTPALITGDDILRQLLSGAPVVA